VASICKPSSWSMPKYSMACRTQLKVPDACNPARITWVLWAEASPGATATASASSHTKTTIRLVHQPALLTVSHLPHATHPSSAAMIVAGQPPAGRAMALLCHVAVNITSDPPVPPHRAPTPAAATRSRVCMHAVHDGVQGLSPESYQGTFVP